MAAVSYSCHGTAAFFYEADCPEAWPDVYVSVPSEAELKAAARKAQREQSIDACLWLNWAHHIETPPVADAPARLLRRLPTKRRTATGTRNHRRRS
jgi:hypothetical protein